MKNKNEQEKEVLTLADSITEQSKSEQDRTQLDKLKSLNLLKFINAQIDRATTKDDLKSSVIEKITERLRGSDPEEELTNVELIKLLEILNKNDTDFSSNVMNSITELYKIKQEEESKNKKLGTDDTPITKEDLKQLKDLSSIFKKLTDSEFPEIKKDSDEEEE